MTRIRPDGKKASYRIDTYLSDIPKDRPISGREYMKKYLTELDERSDNISYKSSYDYASIERDLMRSFEGWQPAAPKEAAAVVETPVVPVPIANPRARKILFD